MMKASGIVSKFVRKQVLIFIYRNKGDSLLEAALIVLLLGPNYPAGMLSPREDRLVS